MVVSRETKAVWGAACAALAGAAALVLYRGEFAFVIVWAVSIIWGFLGCWLNRDRKSLWRMSRMEIDHEAKSRGTLASASETPIVRSLDRGSRILALASIICIFLFRD